MLKFTFSISLIIILFSCSSNKNEEHKNDFNDLNNRKNPTQSNSTVIICHGEDAFAYHIRFCRGLKNCEASTEEISQDEAIELGRRRCGFCF